MDTSVSDWTSGLISSCSCGIYVQYCYVLVISFYLFVCLRYKYLTIYLVRVGQ